MNRLLFPALLLIASVLASPAAFAADAQVAAGTAMIETDNKPGSDTLVVLTSDTTFGPDENDAMAAARYYCANRGKVSLLIGKERPLEFRSQVLQQWSLLTYRCVTGGQAN